MLAPPVGLEPTTSALTVQRSTIELQRNKTKRSLAGAFVKDTKNLPAREGIIIVPILLWQNRGSSILRHSKIGIIVGAEG